MFLSPDELFRMTGYKRPADQCKWLLRRGWAFELSAGNKPIVLRSYVEQKMGAGTRASPNFAALHRTA